LEDALATLLQNQATLVQNQAIYQAQKAEVDQRIAEIQRQMAETERQRVETDRLSAERFARIEAILVDLMRMMERLPEAVREKTGFRPAQPPRPE
jgi:hypothetical protein